MDKGTLIEMAENEVFESDQFDLNPEVRNFKSLFSNEICPRKNDLQTAISFYESLSDEESERRYSIHYWETCSLGAFDSLHDVVMENFHRSIDKRELARREIKNIELLLNDGKCQIMPNKEHLLITEIPAVYEKLITGTWSDFFIAEELDAYERTQEENSQKFFNSLDEIYKRKDKENIHSAHMDLIKESMEANNGPKYVDYFNVDWVAAMQIQSLMWYKAAIEKIMIDGTTYLTDISLGSKESIGRSKGISMNMLMRSNDGYEAIR